MTNADELDKELKALKAKMNPTKGFDITKHKWSDENIRRTSLSFTLNNLVFIQLQNDVKAGDYLTLEKSDAIAIAKHFYLSGSKEDARKFFDELVDAYND